MSMKIDRQLAHSQEMSNKVALLFQKRAKIAHEHFAEQLKSALRRQRDRTAPDQSRGGGEASGPTGTATPSTPRSAPILFWDTMRQRGNNFRRAHARRAAAGAALRLRDGARRPQVRAPGQLCAGAHRAARRRDGRSRSGGPTSSSIRAPATARASAASRTIRRSASRCATATRSTSSSSSAIPSRARRCSTSAKRRRNSCTRCASCIRTARSPRSSATARAAGRR